MTVDPSGGDQVFNLTHDAQVAGGTLYWMPVGDPSTTRVDDKGLTEYTGSQLGLGPPGKFIHVPEDLQAGLPILQNPHLTSWGGEETSGIDSTGMTSDEWQSFMKDNRTSMIELFSNLLAALDFLGLEKYLKDPSMAYGLEGAGEEREAIIANMEQAVLDGHEIGSSDFFQAAFRPKEEEGVAIPGTYDALPSEIADVLNSTFGTLSQQVETRMTAQTHGHTYVDPQDPSLAPLVDEVIKPGMSSDEIVSAVHEHIANNYSIDPSVGDTWDDHATVITQGSGSPEDLANLQAGLTIASLIESGMSEQDANSLISVNLGTLPNGLGTAMVHYTNKQGATVELTPGLGLGSEGLPGAPLQGAAGMSTLVSYNGDATQIKGDLKELTGLTTSAPLSDSAGSQTINYFELIAALTIFLKSAKRKIEETDWESRQEKMQQREKDLAEAKEVMYERIEEIRDYYAKMRKWKINVLGMTIDFKKVASAAIGIFLTPFSGGASLTMVSLSAADISTVDMWNATIGKIGSGDAAHIDEDELWATNVIMAGVGGTSGFIQSLSMPDAGWSPIYNSVQVAAMLTELEGLGEYGDELLIATLASTFGGPFAPAGMAALTVVLAMMVADGTISSIKTVGDKDFNMGDILRDVFVGNITQEYKNEIAKGLSEWSAMMSEIMGNNFREFAEEVNALADGADNWEDKNGSLLKIITALLGMLQQAKAGADAMADAGSNIPEVAPTQTDISKIEGLQSTMTTSASKVREAFNELLESPDGDNVEAIAEQLMNALTEYMNNMSLWLSAGGNLEDPGGYQELSALFSTSLGLSQEEVDQLVGAFGIQAEETAFGAGSPAAATLPPPRA